MPQAVSCTLPIKPTGSPKDCFPIIVNAIDCGLDENGEGQPTDLDHATTGGPIPSSEQADTVSTCVCRGGDHSKACL